MPETTAPFDAFLSTRTFGSLDGIRCVSILAVLYHHSAPTLDWLPMTGRGFLGVDMFFVLSGFLIVTLLLRERRARGDISIRQFYARRALRIFPVYYGLLLALTAFYLWVAPRSGSAGAFFHALPYNLTYTSNWVAQLTVLGIVWSLAAEEQFYLAWPAVQKFIPRAGIFVVLLALIVVNQLMNFRLIDGWFRSTFGVGHADLNMLQITFTPILLGVLLANLMDSPRGFAAVYRVAGGYATPVVWLLLLAALCNLPADDLSGWPRLAIQLCMTVLLASCVASEHHALRPLLAAGPVRGIGAVSYGMYLYHLGVVLAAGFVLRRAGIDSAWALFALTVVLTVFAAELSFRFYEMPFLRLKSRFTPARTPAKTKSRPV